MWTKYSYICTNCDALIEVTTQDSNTIDPACVCSPSAWVTRVAKEDVTQLTKTHLDFVIPLPYN
jgi:hypothetical protein